MPSARIFGTDGIRGRAGEGWLAPERVAAVGLAAGAVLAARRQAPGAAKPRALLGHDGRRSGPELEAALAGGLAKSGFEVTSVGLISTPGLALLARVKGFDLGGMLSASHNPAEDNGVKLFGAGGEKLSDSIELEIERRLDGASAAPGLAAAPRHDPELELAYLAYLVERAGAGLDLDGLPLVVDCANGGASRIAPRVLGRLGARVSAVHAEPDGDNINRGCGSTRPEGLAAEVVRQQARVGFALDGDGDRCLFVDERGRIVHGDGIMTVCARDAMARRAWRDPRVVATVMSNKGLHRALREIGVGVVTVDVGDRNVVEALRRESLALGGEQSGHVVFGPDHFFIGDGIYTALRVLRILASTGRPLSELAASYREFPQVLVNVPVARKPRLSELPAVGAAVARVESELGDDGRVLVRYSGTEPLARVMVEGPDLPAIQRHAHALAQLLAAAIGEK